MLQLTPQSANSKTLRLEKASQDKKEKGAPISQFARNKGNTSVVESRKHANDLSWQLSLKACIISPHLQLWCGRKSASGTKQEAKNGEPSFSERS